MPRERTFLAIKPDGVQRGHVGEIISRFERKGFKLVGMKMMVPPMELLEQHYAEHKGKPFYPSLTGFMSSSAVVAMVWEGNNVVSIASGYSIGGFDADKIEGDTLTLGIGRPGEPYEGIGRGTLNIEGLPVYRDALGGIGTPTSDHERTKLTLGTTRLLAIINGYSGREGLEEAGAYLQDLLRRHAGSDGGTVIRFGAMDN